MSFNFGNLLARRVLKISIGFCAVFILSSCGGGGGSSGTNASGGGTTTPTTTLSLVSPTSATTPLAAYGSTTITVQVLSNGVAGGAGVAVTFSSPCAISGKATLGANATTGSNGQATVTYTDKGCAASDIITISSSGATSITETMQDAMPAAAAIQFVSANPTSDSIVIQGAGGNGRVSTATLTFVVVDTHGNPLPNQTVDFSLFPANIVNLQQTSAITGANGQVVASVSSGTQATTFRVNASVNTTVNNVATKLTTQSDTIIVTTGQTSAASFSLSVDTYNIEGWDYDGTPASITIRLADANGNPVADGTPVVFSTDSGAVGTASNGGCVTTDGACSVPFISQNPRYGAGHTTPPAAKRAGLATIGVSTTTSNSTISGQTGIFLSSSHVASYTIFPGDANGSVSGKTLTLSGCNNTSFYVQLNDVNNNPMPYSTTVAATATLNGTTPTAIIGQVFPSSVLDTGPSSLTDTTSVWGTVHQVTFSAGGGTGTTTVCNSPGSGTMSGEIDLTITTPKGNETILPVYINYPH